MNKHKLSLLLPIALVSLIGCTTTPTITRKPITIPELLTKSTPLAVPPSKESYMSASLQDREELLVNYANKMAIQLGMCNADKNSISDLLKAIGDIYKKD